MKYLQRVVYGLVFVFCSLFVVGAVTEYFYDSFNYEFADVFKRAIDLDYSFYIWVCYLGLLAFLTWRGITARVIKFLDKGYNNGPNE